FTCRSDFSDLTLFSSSSLLCLFLSFLIIPRPPRSPLFPYTTLFRSLLRLALAGWLHRPFRRGGQPHRQSRPRRPHRLDRSRQGQIGRAHVRTPVTLESRMPSSA